MIYFCSLKPKSSMSQYPYLYYQSPFEPARALDTVQEQAGGLACDSVVPSFITEGFGSAITPLPRMTYDILQGWNLVIIALVMLVIVLNKQLYPRQFRQVLSVPGGVAHTNQLLREWNLVRSFLGWTFLLAYLAIVTLFIQKSCVVLTRDVGQFDTMRVFGSVCGIVTGWVLLRVFILYFMNWLFGTQDAVERQMAVQLSVSTYGLLVLLPVLLLLLYNPYSLFVWLGFGVIAVAALVRFVKEVVETRISAKMSAFYIFSYFCALEIAPVATLMTAGLRYINQGSVF